MTSSMANAKEVFMRNTLLLPLHCSGYSFDSFDTRPASYQARLIHYLPNDLSIGQVTLF
jgi:hypothetical protein